MTQPYFYQDPYAKTLTAVVTSVIGCDVYFDQTIFYPLGGGQPGDTGWMRLGDQTIEITDTRKDLDLGIRHITAAPVDALLQVGATVTLELDWARRHRHMQMHTAMHLLGALIDAPVTGGQVGLAKSRLDFDVGDLKLDKGVLTEQLNALIASGADLGFEWVSEALLDAQPELVRTMSVAPPRGVGDIRMVRIPGIDYQPCGGTHVHCLGEIGPLIVSKIENKGRQNRRVHLVFA
jgi:misacylated tRNA(Ala) deacylase|tara:strand:+ start:2399 stop:3103 length:705 start_codon:yes stop_codon:yes gene_type:complete